MHRVFTCVIHRILTILWLTAVSLLGATVVCASSADDIRYEHEAYAQTMPYPAGQAMTADAARSAHGAKHTCRGDTLYESVPSDDEQCDACTHTLQCCCAHTAVVPPPEVAVLFVPGGKAEFPDVPEGQFDLQVVEIFRPPLV